MHGLIPISASVRQLILIVVWRSTRLAVNYGSIGSMSKQDLSNWVSLAEAAARLPSPKAGKRTHISTVYRLARKHGLELRRRGPFNFVYWPDLEDLLQPATVHSPRPPHVQGGSRRTLASQRDLQRRLEEHGLV